MGENRSLPVVVEVRRGGLVESIHHVAACAATPRGDIVLSAGDVARPVYLRSTAKPFIAATAIAAGVRESFGLNVEEVAVMAASHHGEAYHLRAVESILSKIGLGESALQCGPHLPYDEEAAQALLRSGVSPSALHNNCSGKHAGILALCRAIGADTATYLSPENPAQRMILDFCARMCDDDASTWPLAIDGCGIPVFATSLQRTATAFARFASLREIAALDAAALLVVRDAMISYPEYVGGTGEFDSVLMRAGGGEVACKGGAEGVHGVALIDAGIGFASKVLDGSARARAPVSMAALRALHAKVANATELAPFARPVVYNRARRAVGEIRVATDFAVEQASSRT
jgi:L-asparaginase II